MDNITVNPDHLDSVAANQQPESRSHGTDKRFTVTKLMESRGTGAAAGQDVIAGLRAENKYLPPKYFYDQQGSELFERICDLPEYYPTRTETAILKSASGAIAALTGPCEIVELGSGSSTKTRLLLSAYQAAGHPMHYLPVDVSDTMLVATAENLLNEYPALSIHAIASTYEPALKALPPKQLPNRLIAFIGSTIGNFQPHECHDFLALVSKTLRPGEYFLLGLDLQKEHAVLEAAYNDSQGITAAFNLNMLRHLNQRFAGNFKLDGFAHEAHYNTTKGQIEMYLRSLNQQTVRLDELDLTVEFAKGDRILSEISRKFEPKSMTAMLLKHQLNVINAFTDEQQWFGLLLCQRSLS